MKKIIASILCAGLIALTAAGCGYTDALAQNSSSSTTQASESQVSEAEVTDKDFDDNLNGLCNYLAKKGYIVTKDGKIDESQMTKMDAALIGAKEGKKFKASNTLTIEVYEYDTEKLNDTAKEIIASVEDKGEFVILDLPAVKAYMSDSGKYLMIYKDTSIDDSNPDEKSSSYTHREDVLEDFKSFKA